MTNKSFKILELKSKLDKSVNFVLESGQEARFVRREDETLIVYLSSHNGCNKACRFCHLTQTGQTSFDEASLEDMLRQAELVLNHYAEEIQRGRQPAAQWVHFNWMARGEPLASSVVCKQWVTLSTGLAALAEAAGVSKCRFNLSTIFPAEVTPKTFSDLSGPHLPIIFYSLYSLNPRFRKRWLPNAQNPEIVLAELSKWQKDTGGEVVLHWAYIEGENDSPEDSSAIVDAVSRHGLVTRFNLVRYNPFGAGQGAEPSEEVLQDRFVEISAGMQLAGSRMVPRVGFDVKASCGMFVTEIA
jgi:23S rRNA (adenine2503-C2)-methyltransferase